MLEAFSVISLLCLFPLVNPISYDSGYVPQVCWGRKQEVLKLDHIFPVLEIGQNISSFSLC